MRPRPTDSGRPGGHTPCMPPRTSLPYRILALALAMGATAAEPASMMDDVAATDGTSSA